MIRLNKYIAQSGVCSRRKAEQFITDKEVKINGQTVFEQGIMVDETKDIVSVQGKPITLVKKKMYIMLNKPEGYVTTSIEQFDRPCVIDLIKEDERVFAIGRLDMETEGLLLLTNDGDFANRLMHPSEKIKKVYIAKVTGTITEQTIKQLKKGVDIDGYTTAPAIVEKISKDELQITIHEGKNRQVRKMCTAVGLNVTHLKRIKIGNLELGNLKLGKYKLIKSYEIKRLF
ncbi:MAG: pseudouridine synthase [Clostridia bacterium]|nr:pseudouridine synthase [Clostridia bacterium]MDD4386211.1 pseudouridine synthase [Clostridia bacterium]